VNSLICADVPLLGCMLWMIDVDCEEMYRLCCNNQAMAALLAPFGNCVDVLNPAVFQPLLVDGLKMTFNYAKNLDNSEFKDKVCLLRIYITYLRLCSSCLLKC